MRVLTILVSASILLFVTLPSAVAGQACFGRPTQPGQAGVSGIYEPQVDGWGAAVDWNARSLWSLRVQGGTVGEFIPQDELDTHEAWTKIGTVVEGEEEFPIATRRIGEEYLGAEGLVEVFLSDISLCASGGIQVLTGDAALTQRITYLDAIGPQWVNSVQDYTGVRAPMTVAGGHGGLTVGAVDLIPYAAFTFWVDRVTFDRVEGGYTFDGWYGQGGATAVYGQLFLGVGFRTSDDLRDESFLASMGYTF